MSNNSHDDEMDAGVATQEAEVRTRPSGQLATAMIEGMSELREVAGSNPDNLGVQIALAIAFSQQGQLEEAMRIYRRMLARRTASQAVVQVVGERLSDVEDEAAGDPHFHLVRGDLYMKQGRIPEAVDEFNKIV